MFPDNSLLLSVRLMTYNQESCIREAMDSIFAQKTDFNFEIVVGDDFSSDRTVDIIRSYSDTDKISVRVLNRSKGDTYDRNRIHFGRIYNFYDILTQCRGRYIALLDGDDYWTNPLKLKNQVDFLESHPEFIAVSSDTRYLKNNILEGTYKEAKELWLNRKFSSEITYVDVLNRIVPHISSFLFRNRVQFPERYPAYPVGDMPLYLLLAANGKIKFVDEVNSVYRIHSKGTLAGLSNTKALPWMKKINEMAVDVNRFTGGKYSAQTESAILEDYRRLLRDQPEWNLFTGSLGQIQQLKNEKLIRKFSWTDRFSLAAAFVKGIMRKIRNIFS